MRLERIDELTQSINGVLHKSCGMTDLQDRMLFTACTLVAIRYQSPQWLLDKKGGDYSALRSDIADVLKAHTDEKGVPEILEEYDSIRADVKDDGKALDTYIDAVCETAEMVNSDSWKGVDVMAIFFNEFTRYRGKSDAGQVFTPDHIASFMYRLIDVKPTDRVLDPTCGSGTLIVKAMSKMLGAATPDQVTSIKQDQIYGIEYMRKVYALACANFLLYKDGRSNIVQMDAKSHEASEWIKSKAPYIMINSFGGYQPFVLCGKKRVKLRSHSQWSPNYYEDPDELLKAIKAAITPAPEPEPEPVKVGKKRHHADGPGDPTECKPGPVKWPKDMTIKPRKIKSDYQQYQEQMQRNRAHLWDFLTKGDKK